MNATPDRNPAADGRATASVPAEESLSATSTPASPVGSADPSAAPPLAKWLAIYTLLRIATLVVLTALLSLLMPVILALLFAVVLALPLSWVVFGGVRRRVNEAMAVATASRRTERERLRAALDGRDPE